MNTTNIVVYVFLFFIVFRLLLGKQWVYIFMPTTKRENFKPMRYAYNRAHKIIRRRVRPYREGIEQWLLPYKRMLF